MRKLATNELRLLAIFGAAVFLALNIFIVSTWTQQHKATLTRIASAHSELAEGQALIEGAQAIQSSREWINANPPPEKTAYQASTDLLQFVRSSAEADGLKVLEENLLPAVEAATGSAAALDFKLAGPFPGVAKFLFALQNPTAWRSVDKLIVRSDTEPPNVLVDMKIRQYYHASTPAPPAPGP